MKILQKENNHYEAKMDNIFSVWLEADLQGQVQIATIKPAIWSEEETKQISQARCFSLQSHGGHYSMPCYLKGVCKLIFG